MRSVDSGQNRLEFKSQNHLFQPRCSWASWWTPPTLHIFIYKIRKIIAQRIVVKAKHNNPWKNLAQGLGFCLCNSYKKAKKKKKEQIWVRKRDNEFYFIWVEFEIPMGSGKIASRVLGTWQWGSGRRKDLKMSVWKPMWAVAEVSEIKEFSDGKRVNGHESDLRKEFRGSHRCATNNSP